jgi:hypothetical protein
LLKKPNVELPLLFASQKVGLDAMPRAGRQQPARGQRQQSHADEQEFDFMPSDRGISHETSS